MLYLHENLNDLEFEALKIANLLIAIFECLFYRKKSSFLLLPKGFLIAYWH